MVVGDDGGDETDLRRRCRSLRDAEEVDAARQADGLTYSQSHGRSVM